MLNFNGSTPAAPAGNTNVTWQNDISGNVSAYLPNSTQNLTGSAVNLTAQAADIAATTLFSPTASGLFRVSIYIIVTQAATVSSTMPATIVTWTDADNNTTQTFTLTASSAGNLLTTVAQGDMVIDAKALANIQYSTSGYASSGATPMQFALHIRIEAL